MGREVNCKPSKFDSASKGCAIAWLAQPRQLNTIILLKSLTTHYIGHTA